MTFKVFGELWQNALDAPNLDLFIAEPGWDSWMDEFSPGDDAGAVIEVMTVIFQMAQEGFPAIRRHSGLTQARFAQTFGIPLRTVEEWDRGRMTPPPYTLRALAWQVLDDLLHPAN